MFSFFDADTFLYQAFQEEINFEKQFKGAVMQIEKALINDCLRVSKVSGKFRIPTVYNFAVIYT